MHWYFLTINAKRTMSHERTPFQSGINEKRLEKDESATYNLCHCEAIAYVWYHHSGHYFTGPGDYLTDLVSKILHFIQSVRLLKGWNRGEYTIDHLRMQCKGQPKPTPYSFIQLSMQLRAKIKWGSLYFNRGTTTTVRETGITTQEGYLMAVMWHSCSALGDPK